MKIHRRCVGRQDDARGPLAALAAVTIALSVGCTLDASGISPGKSGGSMGAGSGGGASSSGESVASSSSGASGDASSSSSSGGSEATTIWHSWEATIEAGKLVVYDLTKTKSAVLNPYQS